MWSPNKAQWDDEEEDVYFKTTISSTGETVTEEIPIESKGYKILKDDTIKCADCGKKLVDIIKVKENESLRKVISARCPCGGESFLYVITGETYMQASEGRAITDMPTEVKDGIVHMTVEVI
jgi:hypothetical protein